MHLSESVITVIILLTLIGSHIAETIADILNLKNIQQPLPDEFKGFYDAQKYKTSQNYLKTNTTFGIISSGFDLAVILIFWFSKGFAALDTFVRSFEWGPVPTGLLYIGILLGLKLILSLPFSLYATFVIEEKYGFNKTTLKIFIIDLIKSVLLSIVLGGILLSLILLFFEYAGSLAWLLCWVASVLFLLLVQYIVPTFILPLFNKFTPLEEGQLKEAIMDYASSIQFSISNIFVMDGSKRSSKSNAFFTGFGKNKRIVLFDTLIKEQSVEELVAVLAHEMGHYKKKHVIKRMVLAFGQTGIIFYLLSLFISQQGLFNAFFVPDVSVYAGLIFFGMLYTPIDLIVSIVLQNFSRRDEKQADEFAAQTVDDPDALARALKKLSAHNLSNLFPHPFYVMLHYSHPPVMERLACLKK